MKIFKLTILITCISFVLQITNDVKASQSSQITTCIHVDHNTNEYTKYHVLNSNEDVFDCPDPDSSRNINKVGSSQNHVRTTKLFIPNSIHAADPECIYSYTRI